MSSLIEIEEDLTAVGFFSAIDPHSVLFLSPIGLKRPALYIFRRFLTWPTVFFVSCVNYESCKAQMSFSPVLWLIELYYHVKNVALRRRELANERVISYLVHELISMSHLITLSA